MLQSRVFVQAAHDIDDAVDVRFVGPGDDTAGTVGAEGGLHLIAAVAGDVYKRQTQVRTACAPVTIFSARRWAG